MHQRLGLLRPVRRGGNGQPSGGCWHTLGALRHRRPALWLATTSGFWLSFAVNFAANKYVTFAARTNGRRQLVRYSVLVRLNFLVNLVIVTALVDLGLAAVVS